jgi:hypothetical protein
MWFATRKKKGGPEYQRHLLGQSPLLGEIYRRRKKPEEEVLREETVSSSSSSSS